ncbi:MAG: bifunctional glutamate N-acetyltransferase/amino-acid acetyltransferase ArgJ [Nitrospirae bacterium]|nr:bifunctional glutamate N-acetyltransferase/amino-acid acetyltransferase ArgJ [Nitrospirota bacterium]
MISKNPKSEIRNPKLRIPGFKLSGISVGIKKKRKKDLALIFSETPANVAGIFTTNKIKAAPVRLDIERLASKKGQAIIINSGNANACTGKQGLKDAEETADITAKELGISSSLVYVASTGIIGRTLPMHKIKKAIPILVKKLSLRSINDVASAMMTTDTFPKIFSKKVEINGATGILTGIAKGAGMISPNMATMLCFILTNISVKIEALDSALRIAADKSFNRLVIDNDMSTNDTVLIMANGILKNIPIGENSPLYNKFENALLEVTYNLSKMIARDGEGATKLIEVIVKGTKTETDAEKVARAIANSLLVKTAIYGKNPNWGRIMAAIGYAGIDIKEDKISIYLNNLKLVDTGIGTNMKNKARDAFSEKEITLTVDLGLGKKEAKILTCDLTEEYIKINARYT